LHDGVPDHLIGHELQTGPYPIVLDNLLQRFVTADSCKSSLPGEIGDFAALDIEEPEFIESQILSLNVIHVSVDLPEQQSPLCVLERKKVELYRPVKESVLVDKSFFRPS